MFVISKRSILFQEWSAGKVLRSHHVTANKDPQEIPDWVRGLNSFKLACKDNTIMEIIVKSVTEAAPAPEAAETVKSEVVKPPLVDLKKLNRKELQEHAKVHGFELSGDLTKDEMVAAIKDARDSS